jgi:hypothetical protein
MSTEKRSLGDITADFQVLFSQIEAKKSELESLESQASKIGEEMIKGYNKGPHPIQVPDLQQPGKNRTLVVVFKRVSKMVHFDTSDVTQLMAQLTANVTQTPPALPVTAPPAPPPLPTDDPMARIKNANA